METYRERGITFAFAGMKGPVRDLVSKSGWTEKCAHCHYVSVQEALRSLGVWDQGKA